MKEFDELEKSLRRLKPRPPDEKFVARIESALGDAGNLAIRCLPEEESAASMPSPSSSSSSFFRPLLFFTGALGAGLAAVWIFFANFSPSPVPEPAGRIALLGSHPDVPLAGDPSDDPDSPLHGVSLSELPPYSGMPVSGWSDPQVNERFLRMVDEGLIDRPGRLPARQVRHYFMDETIWSHPASDLRILSTTPREEVILIELEAY